MSGFVSNFSVADMLRYVNVTLCEGYNTKIYVDYQYMVLENTPWKFIFEGDGIIRVSNENYPEIEIAICDDDYCEKDYYNHNFLCICKELFLKEAKEMKIDKMVAAMISDEEKAISQAFAKGEISYTKKDRKLLALYDPQHLMDLREAIRKTI